MIYMKSPGHFFKAYYTARSQYPGLPHPAAKQLPVFP
jgi:hypothetical protein